MSNQRRNDVVRLHTEVAEELQEQFAQFGRARARAEGGLLSALDTLDRTDNPGSEWPSRPPIRRFTRDFDQTALGLEIQWLWVYFAEIQSIPGASYLVVGLFRTVGAITTSSGIPPEPPDAAWEMARDRLYAI